MTPGWLAFDHARNVGDQVEERFDEAGLTLAALPSHGIRPASAGAFWPEIVRDLDELGWGAESDERMPRPSAAAVARMDEALAWLSLLDGRDERLRKVINMRLIVHPISRMHRYSWRQIGGRLGISDDTARRWHRQACERIGRKIALAKNKSCI